MGFENNELIEKQIKNKVGSLLLIFILICSGSLVILSSNQNSYNVHAASTWTHETAKNFKNGTWDNLTVLGTAEDAELKINLSGLHTWTKVPQKTKPIGNYYHEMVSIWGTDKVMLFGGYGYYNTTWVYDLSNGTWTKKNTLKSPPARYWQGMASVWGDDKVVLYGGMGATTIFQDTWVYDSSEGTWTEQTPGGSLPMSTTFNHNMATIWGTKKVLLFGGLYYNETWIYDLESNIWTRKYPPISPEQRWYQSLSSIHGTDKVVLYGGQYNMGYFDDTWIYDLSEDTWTKISTTTNPGPRTYCAMFPLFGTDIVILFGGWWSNSNDIWLFDYSDFNWSQKIPTNQLENPISGWYHTMAPFYNTDKALLFGGYYYYYIQDTWIYRHSSPTRNGTFVSAAHDTGSPSTYKTITWKAKVPTNTSLRFQLRTAANESQLDSKDFVGPDGKTSSYYTSSPTNIWSKHNGDQWIQCKIFFNISFFTEMLRLDKITILYNCIPTTIALGPLDGILLANNKPLFLWTFKDYDSNVQKAFQVLIDGDIEFKSVDYNSGEQNSSNNQWQFPFGTNYEIISDGSWYWKVCTQDEDGMWTEYTEPRLIIIDTKVPNSVMNIPNNNGYYNNMDTISGIATDGGIGSGISQIEISIKRLSDNSYWSGFSWVQLPTWLLASGDIEWVYDSGNVTWTSGTRYLIQSRATDKASNIEPLNTGNTFNMDMDGPISVINSPKNSVWLNKLESISGTSFDISGSGVVEVEISLKCLKNANLEDGDAEINNYWNGREWSSKETWLATKGTDQWIYNSSTIPYFSGNEYFINCRGVDGAGNLEVPTGGHLFMFDSILPSNLSININNGDKYTNSNTVTLSLYAEDIGSGVSQMAFSTDNSEWSEWEPFTSKMNFSLPTNDGDKTVFFRVKDLAGNIAEPVQSSIYLDTTPPDGLSIVINGNDKYTKSKNVKLTVLGVDTGSGIMDISYSDDGMNWDPWEPYRTSRRFMVSGEDGEKIIYFKLRDNAGNIGEPIHDNIILDTTPPHSLLIVINNGALQTNSTLVTLNFNAIDDTSRVTKMSINCDGTVWSPWENYTFFKYYTLTSGEGNKTVFFKVVDAVGNEAEPVSASITLIFPSPQAKEESHRATNILSSINLWIIIFIVVMIILLAINIVLILRKKKHPEHELPSGTLTIKPSRQFGPVESLAQVPGTVQINQLPGTAVASDSQQLGVATPTLAKSTLATQSPGKKLELPALPPAKIQGEEPETSTTTISTPEPTAVVQAQTATPIQSQTRAQPQVHLPPSASPTPTVTPSAPPQSVTPTPKTTPDIMSPPGAVPKPQLSPDLPSDANQQPQPSIQQTTQQPTTQQQTSQQQPTQEQPPQPTIKEPPEPTEES